jgi:hypothetical protein
VVASKLGLLGLLELLLGLMDLLESITLLVLLRFSWLLEVLLDARDVNASMAIGRVGTE